VLTPHILYSSSSSPAHIIHTFFLHSNKKKCSMCKHTDTPDTQQTDKPHALQQPPLDDIVVIEFTDFADTTSISALQKTRSPLSEVAINRQPASVDKQEQLAQLLAAGQITQQECEQLLFKEDVAQHLTETAINATNNTAKSGKRKSLIPSLNFMLVEGRDIYKEVQSAASDAAATAAAAVKKAQAESSANLDNLREAAKAKQDYTASVIANSRGKGMEMLSSSRSAIETMSDDPKSAFFDAWNTSAAKVQAAIDEQKKRFGQTEAEDILPYSDNSDNAAAYRKHEMLIDVHDDWLKTQSQKDVRSLLRQEPRLPRDVDRDIVLRAGVLPAPSGGQLILLEMAEHYDPDDEHSEFNLFGGTPAELRAAQERQALEVVMGRKRKKTQLLKMEKQTSTLVKLEKKNRRRSSTNRDNLLAIQRKLQALEDVDI